MVAVAEEHEVRAFYPTQQLDRLGAFAACGLQGIDDGTNLLAHGRPIIDGDPDVIERGTQRGLEQRQRCLA